jgi:hypothetical protein
MTCAELTPYGCPTMIKSNIGENILTKITQQTMNLKEITFVTADEYQTSVRCGDVEVALIQTYEDFPSKKKYWMVLFTGMPKSIHHYGFEQEIWLDHTNGNYTKYYDIEKAKEFARNTFITYINFFTK